MKKIVCFLATLILIFLLTSCRNVSGDVDTTLAFNDNVSGDVDTTLTFNDSLQDIGVSITSIGPFSDGLARISTDQGYGYIDTKGKIVIKPQYDTASELFNTLALVSKDGQSFFINRSAEIVYTQNGNEVEFGKFSNGFFWTETIEKLVSGNVHTINYYNEKGEKQFSIQDAKNAGEYTAFGECGYALIKRTNSHPYFNDEYDIVDTTGKRYTFDGIWFDTNNSNKSPQYKYCIGGYIDLANQTVVPMFNVTDNIGQYPLVSMNGNYGYSEATKLDGYGLYIYNGATLVLSIPRDTERADSHPLAGATSYYANASIVDGNTYFTIYMKNQDGVYFSAVIDEKGTVILAPTESLSFVTSERQYSIFGGQTIYYEEDMYIPNTFNNGLCAAKDTKTGLYGYIDIYGNWVIEAKYNSVTDFYGTGIDAVATVDGNTVINQSGEVLYQVSN